MSETRRAALTLHALPEADRAWLLRRLDPRQQLLLAEHLTELQSLGIPADRALVEQALQSNSDEDADPVWRRSLSACSGDAIHKVLSAEPASLIARVLSAARWPWERDVWERFTIEQRSAIDRCRQQTQARSHDLDEWLCGQIALRCTELKTAGMAIVASRPDVAVRPKGRKRR